VEVVDLENLNASCNFNVNSPLFDGLGLGGGLTISGKPLVCGGGTDYTLCQIYSDGEWREAPPLLKGAKYFGASSSPIENKIGSELFITGWLLNNKTVKQGV